MLYFNFNSHVKTVLKLLVLWYPAVWKLFISPKFTISTKKRTAFDIGILSTVFKMLSGSLSFTNNIKSVHTLAESVWRTDGEILTRTKLKRYQFQL